MWAENREPCWEKKLCCRPFICCLCEQRRCCASLPLHSVDTLWALGAWRTTPEEVQSAPTKTVRNVWERSGVCRPSSITSAVSRRSSVSVTCVRVCIHACESFVLPLPSCVSADMWLDDHKVCWAEPATLRPQLSKILQADSVQARPALPTHNRNVLPRWSHLDDNAERWNKQLPNTCWGVLAGPCGKQTRRVLENVWQGPSQRRCVQPPSDQTACFTTLGPLRRASTSGEVPRGAGVLIRLDRAELICDIARHICGEPEPE